MVLADDRIELDRSVASVFGAAVQGARQEQQDVHRIVRLERDGSYLVVLADGMGGHACGALAAELATEAFVSAFLQMPRAESDLGLAFERALQSANVAVADARNADVASRDGMGTTLLAVHLSPQGLSWISVGDSPLLLYRNGLLQRLNEDHSLRELGAVNGASANMLRSAVFGGEIPLTDSHPEPLQVSPDDLILVASDGILTLSDDQIASTIGSAGAADTELLAWLILHAVEDKRKSHQDNCSLVVLRPEGPAPTAEPKPQSRLSRKWLAIGLAVVALSVVILSLAYLQLLSPK